MTPLLYIYNITMHKKWSLLHIFLIPNIWETIWTVPFFLSFLQETCLCDYLIYCLKYWQWNQYLNPVVYPILIVNPNKECVCVCVEGSRSGMWSGVGQRCVSVIWSVSAVMRSFLLTWCCCTRLILMECVTLRRPTWMEKPTSNKGRWSVTCHSRWVASLSISLSSSSLLSFFFLHIFMRWHRFCQKESVFFVLKSIKLFKINKMQFI